MVRDYMTRLLEVYTVESVYACTKIAVIKKRKNTLKLDHQTWIV